MKTTTQKNQIVKASEEVYSEVKWNPSSPITVAWYCSLPKAKRVLYHDVVIFTPEDLNMDNRRRVLNRSVAKEAIKSNRATAKTCWNAGLTLGESQSTTHFNVSPSLRSSRLSSGAARSLSASLPLTE